MKLLSLALVVLAAALIFGCTAAEHQKRVGSDKDEYGCIGSAGYTWCAATQKCIRTWEENCTAAVQPMPGSDRDPHGCIPSAGYTWCEESQKCIRTWEENCTSELVGSDKDEHGCIGSAGYSWCPELAKCVRIWEEDCPSLRAAALEAQAKTYCAKGSTVSICGSYIKVVSDMPGAGSSFYTLGNYDPIRCPLVSPEYMSEQCRLLVMGNNCIDVPVQCSFAPPPVTDLKDNPSFVGAQLWWSKPGPSAVAYAIYRNDDELNTSSFLGVTQQTSYNDVFFGDGKTYTYFVRVRDASGAESADSNRIYVKQLSTATQPSPGQIN